MRGGDGLDWVDIAGLHERPKGLPEHLSLVDLMRRFTICRQDGLYVSGGAGFVSLWRALGPLRWLGVLTDHKVGRGLGELAYRLFLRLRILWRKPG